MSALLPSNIHLVKQGLCPLCRSQQNFRKLFELRFTELFRCACGTRFIDPSLDGQSMMAIYESTETLKLISPVYENYYEYDTLNRDSLTYHHYEKTLQEMARLLGPHRKKLLEAGCGAGSFLKVAKEMGWEAHGVDSSKTNIQKIKEAGIEGHVSDFLQFDLGETKFDAVVLWDLIEHPQDPGAFIRHAQQILNPSGLLVLVTPCYPNALSFLSELFMFLSAGKINGPANRLYFLEHTTYLNEKSLSSALRQENLTVVRTWKEETDLKRYTFTPFARLAVSALFFAARLFGFQNRIHLIAQKPR